MWFVISKSSLCRLHLNGQKSGSWSCKLKVVPACYAISLLLNSSLLVTCSFKLARIVVRCWLNYCFHCSRSDNVWHEMIIHPLSNIRTIKLCCNTIQVKLDKCDQNAREICFQLIDKLCTWILFMWTFKPTQNICLIWFNFFITFTDLRFA